MIADKFKALGLGVNTSIRSHNLNRRTSTIRAIVLHDTAGSGKHGDTLYIFTNEEALRRGVSIDFTVERDGTVYQGNPDLAGLNSNHAGRSTKLHTGRGFVMNGGVNECTIGIEMVQKAALDLVPMWPKEQVRSVGLLCAALCVEFGLKKEAITTHAKIITDGSRSDPRKFDWTLFWANFDNAYALLTGETAPSNAGTTPVLNTRIEYKALDGDTLWGISNKFNVPQEKIKALNGMNDASNTVYAGRTYLIRE